MTLYRPGLPTPNYGNGGNQGNARLVVNRVGSNSDGLPTTSCACPCGQYSHFSDDTGMFGGTKITAPQVLHGVTTCHS